VSRAKHHPQQVVVDRTSGGGEPITQRESREAILLTARDELTITWYRLAPGERGPDPHVHHEHTDAFYVLTGELGFVLGPDREPISVGAGGMVAAPPNVVHTFANESDGEVRFLNLHAPDGGFAEFMRARRDGDEQATFDTLDPPPDGGRSLSEAVVSRPGEGERLSSANRVALVKSALPDLFLAEFELDGRYDGPDLHDYGAEVDSFYVLDGKLEFTIEDSRCLGGPETLASVPVGLRHTFTHPGPGHARFLNIHAPEGGFTEFLRRVSDPSS
jgi:mannose-6-phosphate isomerase-like protein (cupin superfamily)